MKAPCRILIVDDDKEDQAFLSEALCELYPDLPCLTTCNGKEALEYIKSDPPPPEIIFLDLNMPVLNGYEFLRDYKKVNNWENSKIIIYTTSSHPRDKALTTDLGASAYLTKFTDYDMLKNEVKGLVEKFCKS